MIGNFSKAAFYEKITSLNDYIEKIGNHEKNRKILINPDQNFDFCLDNPIDQTSTQNNTSIKIM